MPLMRYPGGNFVSCYDWKDGIGPREQRPARPDYAWRSIETNQFGTDEFMAWCEELRTEPMMAVNLGTGGTAEAAAAAGVLQPPGGTYWADQRGEHGHPEPYGVKLWCLGNEMDGNWQAGHVPAEVYAQRAGQAGLMMKGLDPRSRLVVCGSSHDKMRTYMEWDRTVLEYCWEYVDYLSAHRYSENQRDDSAWYLADGVEIERDPCRIIRALLGYVRAVKKSNKRVYLSFDEWNVWYRARRATPSTATGRGAAPARGALQPGGCPGLRPVSDQLPAPCRRGEDRLHRPDRERDRADPDPPRGLLLQSIYHPFALFSQHAAGNALTPVIDAPRIRRASAARCRCWTPRPATTRRRYGGVLPGQPRATGGTARRRIDVADQPIARVLGA